MEKLLKPETFETLPDAESSAQCWDHWKIRFNKFVLKCKDATEEDKLDLLNNLISPFIYPYISDCKDIKAALKTLDSIYNPQKSVIYTRHLLTTCKQELSEPIDAYFQRLKALARDCQFEAVDKPTHENEAIRDAFVAGISSANIRQRLLECENDTKLDQIYTLARSLEVAKIQAETYDNRRQFSVNSAHHEQKSSTNNSGFDLRDVSAALPQHSNPGSSNNSGWKCYNCGDTTYHKKAQCTAKKKWCSECGQKGHLGIVCKKNPNPSGNTKQVSAIHFLAASPPSLSPSIRKVVVNGVHLDALFDSGSSASFIDERVVKQHAWTIDKGSNDTVCMASSAHVARPSGSCIVDLSFCNERFKNKTLTVMKNLCADLIIGLDILSAFSSVTMQYGGVKEPLTLCTAHSIDPPILFGDIDPSCKAIAMKSRRYSEPDKKFIKQELQKLHNRDAIESSRSPYRAQVLVVKGDDNHDDRMVIDFSQTINRHTKLDAYPVPRIDEMVESLSKYRYFTTLDLSSAYHQIPIAEHERPYTAFEADGKLYQFKTIPFGVTNGVAAFQRTMDNIVSKEELEATFIYVDNITIAGLTQEEHNKNVAAFMTAASKYNLQFNDKKTIANVQSIKLLGYLVSYGSIQPDPDRIQPLLDLPVPHDEKTLASALGLFAHYSCWIQNFSAKIRPLSKSSGFPLDQDAREAFSSLKTEVANAVLSTPDVSVPFVLETDASDYAIGATLNQNGRPVAFFSRTLNTSERKHHSVEKEAYAIVEAIRKWKHYLLGSHFTVITDQRSVSFMFDQCHHGKIKNDKITRWRIELAPFDFDIIHRPGKLNASADALSRSTGQSSQYCAAVTDLKTLHEQLCHPGISRFYHFVRARNLPFSMEDVKKVVNSCRDCAEIKPRYFKPAEPQRLIKALAPFERLNIDFKGPLPSSTKNKFLLSVIDEYSRYPFAFPLPDTSTENVIRCFLTIFSVFGMPSYVHSDNGSSLISAELKTFLLERGIATSRCTRYNPQGNGQVEKYNGVVWKAAQLALKSRKLPVTQWELVLTDVLHSLRSLLCTATNETPHDRVFKFPRKSTSGSSIPSWLLQSDKALMKRHVRQSKYEPLVEEVDLLDVNPSTSHVRTVDGREMTVSNRHLAPIGCSRPSGSLQDNSSTENPHPLNVQDPTSIPAESPDDSELLESDGISDDILPVQSIDRDLTQDCPVVHPVNTDHDQQLQLQNSDFVRYSTRKKKQTEFYGV